MELSHYGQKLFESSLEPLTTPPSSRGISHVGGGPKYSPLLQDPSTISAAPVVSGVLHVGGRQEETPLLQDVLHRGNTMPGEPLELVVECVYVPFISSVDTSHCTFNARADLDLSWLATREDIAAFQADPVNYRPAYAPNVVAQNGNDIVGAPVERQFGGLYEVKEDCNHVRLRFAGEWIADFNVANFPFDLQNLTLIYSLSYTDISQVVFNTVKKPNNFTVLRRFLALVEYHIDGLALCSHEIDNFSHIVATIQLTRYSKSYVLSLIVPTFLLGLVSLTPFVEGSFIERLSMQSTIMLAMIALLFVNPSSFHFEVTILDRYMYSTFSLITSILFMFVVIQLSHSTREWFWVVICVVAFSVIQIELIWRARSARYARRADKENVALKTVRHLLDQTPVMCSAEDVEYVAMDDRDDLERQGSRRFGSVISVINSNFS
mmetsp:Transcript_118098/g.214781  ORF Transcript_118098/g.214781 Transcript_118098/m.214781 type:complete len:436 (-) Transcript_118098:75-1382(-)